MSAPKGESGGIFAALAKHIKPYAGVRSLIAGNKTALEAYYVLVIWLFFFFFWLPWHPEAAYYTGTAFTVIVPLVLPFLLFRLLEHAWFDYWWTRRYFETEHCLVEIRLPEDLNQTPYAAELMLRGLYQTGEVDTPLHEFWGQTRAWFSLEIVSTGGKIRFYMWMRRKYKQLAEAQIYAHYPDVQVVEVPDYTLQVPLDPAVVSMWGVEQQFQKPDPYPLLTYVEIGMDKPGLKEEDKFDPLASLIEFLGTIKEGQHIWVQFIIRAHQKGKPLPWAQISSHHDYDFEEWTKVETDNILETVKDERGKINFIGLTKTDKDKIEAMHGKLNKQIFEVGIRTLYIARKDMYDSNPRRGIPSAFRSFEHGSEGRGLNGLKPIFWIGPFNLPWQDFRNIRRHMLWRRYYDAYITRQYFYPPHRHRYIALNSEELATMYHFPGRVIRTPTLQRLPARRSEAPSNLPT